jgi:hypothetical protein
MSISISRMRTCGIFALFVSRLQSALALCGIMLFVLQAQATVVPPPLPPGSALVQPGPGINPEEQARGERAHHHKAGFHSDPTNDDSVVAVPVNTLNPFVPLGGSSAAGLAPPNAPVSRTGDSK